MRFTFYMKAVGFGVGEYLTSKLATYQAVGLVHIKKI